MSTRRKKLIAAGVLIAAFGLGTVTGGGATLLVVRHRVRALLQGPPSEIETRGLVFALDRELRLTERQRVEVASIYRKHVPELNRIRRGVEPELAAERAEAAAEIRATLDPTQQQAFDEMFKRFEERRQKMLESP